MHDGPARGGKLVSASVALPLIALRDFTDAHVAATNAGYPMRPANILKGLAALVIGFVFIEQRKEDFHGSRLS